MIRGLDSSFDRPTSAILAQARAAGVQVWGGYLVSLSDEVVLAARNVGTPGLLGLAAPWTIAEFGDVLDAGLRAIGFCSGNDDAAAVGEKARANGILPCLDDEDGIRAIAGGWQQGWLNAAQAGHYGGEFAATTHAPFQIVAYYPGQDPESTWPGWLPRPAAEAYGWQWQGSHQEFGITVDSLWLDDWFAPGVVRGGDVVFDSSGRPHQSFVAPAGPDGTRHVFYGWGDLGASGNPANGVLQDWGGDAWPLSDRIGIAPNGDVWVDVAGPTGLVFRNVNGAGWQKLSGAELITVALPPAAGQLVAHTHLGGQTGPAQAS